MIATPVQPTTESARYNAAADLVGRNLPARAGKTAFIDDGGAYTYGELAQRIDLAAGAPLVLCPECQMRGHADRNASLVIGQRLIERYAESFKEKPHTAVRRAGRVEQSTGVVLSQEAQSKGRPSPDHARHGDGNGHGTAQGSRRRMGTAPPSIPPQLRLFNE